MTGPRRPIPSAVPTLAGALWFGAVCFFAGAPTAHAQAGRRLLLDGELQARPIKLVSLTSDTIVYEDDKGRKRTATVGGFVGLLPMTPPYGGAPVNDAYTPRPDASDGYEANEARASDPVSPSEPSGVLELTDGQRFPGERVASGGDPDAITWSHPAFGRITAPLDRVAEVVLDAGVRRQLREQGRLGAYARDGAADAPRSQDELLLSNGDTLSGFISTIGDPIRIEVDGSPVDIAPQRVAAARLASRPEALGGLVVWLEDGTVAVVASIGEQEQAGSLESDRLRIQLPAGQSASFALDDLRAVAFDAGKLRPLAGIRPQSQKAVGRRLLLEGVRVLSGADDGAGAGQLSAPDLELPGPMQAVWRLPPGARRFAGVAELPPEALPWGDCEVVVAVDGVEAWRTRLHSAQPRAEFSVALMAQSAGGAAGGARDLTITVEPGQRGPINDRVVLRRPLLLVEPR